MAPSTFCASPNRSPAAVKRRSISAMVSSPIPSSERRVERPSERKNASLAAIVQGPHTFEYVKKYVDDIVTVTDDEISAAILALIEKQKLIAEGAGAASVAAAMFHKVPVEGKKVVCLVSGGNIDVTILSRVIKRGLLMSGRSCMLNIELLDKPGQLKDVSRIIADLGGNVISIHHERASEGSDINGCFLRITMETRDYAHIQEIRSALMEAGFHLVD